MKSILNQLTKRKIQIEEMLKVCKNDRYKMLYHGRLFAINEVISLVQDRILEEKRNEAQKKGRL